MSWSDSAMVVSSASRSSLGRPAFAQGRLGLVAQPRQRRLEIVGDIVGDLLEPLHQLLDAVEHGVEVGGERVELVVRAW